MTPTSVAPPSTGNHLVGRVVNLSSTGAHLRLLIDGGFPLVALVTRRSVEDLGLHEGAPVTAHFKTTAAHLLPGSRAVPSTISSGAARCSIVGDREGPG